MPKPLTKLPVPPKPKRSNDPNLAVHQQMAELEARMNAGPPKESQTFEEMYSARMKALGSKGGKIGGAKRGEMPAAKRKALARKAAQARWGTKAKD